MKIALIIATSLSILTLNAQRATDRCGENYVKQRINQAYGSYEETRSWFHEIVDQEVNNSGDQPEAQVYTIPVVVHIIYETAEDNITREQVLDAIRVLNRDYRRLNADTANTRAIFKSVAADTEIEFRLAKKDEQGNCTEGITRTYSTLTNNANDNVKPLSHWDNKKYMNIWVVRNISLPGAGNTTLGYAYKPSPNQSYIYDGIVIRHDQMGEIGTAITGGRTLVHESGHYLGLDHTFDGGCFNGDNCSDTPPVANPNYQCDLTINSCHNDSPDLLDQVENYMDYGDDPCLNMYTICQRGKMRGSLANSILRGYLVTSNNYLATGIEPNQVLPCSPEADFEAEQTLICEGESIQFEDKTYMGNPTSYQWTFPGGTPASSTSQNPLVTYNQKGSFEVSLVVTNANGSSSEIRTGYISVRSQTNTPWVNGFGDNFEQFPIPNDTWHVVPGLDTNNFRYFTQTAFAGQSCVTLQNFNALWREKDEMISHAILVANSKEINLTYQYAFAESAFGNSDKLKVYISDDCGVTWDLVSTRLGPLLRTTNTRHTTSWFPGQASEWKLATTNLDAYAFNPTPIMIKFEFENGAGNNFYLDDVMVSTALGTERLFVNNDFRVYPNPAQNEVQIELNKGGALIVLTDLSGKTIFQKEIDKNTDKTQLQLSDFAPGLYMLTVYQNGVGNTQKLIIQ